MNTFSEKWQTVKTKAVLYFWDFNFSSNVGMVSEITAKFLILNGGDVLICVTEIDFPKNEKGSFVFEPGTAEKRIGSENYNICYNCILGAILSK